MKLVVTIDVEEEGLFQNRYAPHDAPVNNVAELVSLDPIFREWGIRPTLLVTHAVMRREPCGDLLARLRETWQGEIGAHLHHWNTPPLVSLPYPDPAPSELMPVDLLSSKLESLLTAVKTIGIAPTSFRMGRFNLGPRMFSILEQAGILVDSSIAPMRAYYGGPDHLSAPTDPYFPDPKRLLACGNSRILEAPMTILPVFKGLGRLLERFKATPGVGAKWAPWFAMHLGSLPVQPMWTGLRRLQAGAMLHASRGGRALTIFFHSSELMPGGCPEHQSSAHVDRFRRKLNSFFAWLHREFSVESITLAELGELYRCERMDRAGPVPPG
jgi:hypothetical protein